ncbi:MAG: ABC transporter permease [Pseudomonadota bacterium]
MSSTETRGTSLATGRRNSGDLGQLLLRPEVTAIIGAITVFIFFAIIAGDQGFLTFSGTKNYLQVASMIGIIAVPVTLLMIAGEFDLSVGVAIGCTAMITAYTITELEMPLLVALAFGLFVGALIGFANGILVVWLGIPSFLVTLGMMFVLRGLTLAGALSIIGTTQIFGMNRALSGDWFAPLFSGSLFGFPASIFWWLGLSLLGAYVLTRTKYGNWIYATGGDREAAVKMGIPVRRLKIVLFMLCGMSAAIVGTLNMLYVDLTEATQGLGREFEAITAVVVGGTAIMGGMGSPIGTIFGALIFGMISQGFFYTNISDSWFYSVVGTTLLVAVIINNYTRQAALTGRRAK